MSKINIRGAKDVDDPLYRYKMEKLAVTKLKTKTELSNIPTVSKDLSRDSHMIIEFFKKKFGVNFTNKEDKYTTTKSLTYEELDSALREFIEYFILCPQCRLPETIYTFDEKDNFCMTCKCCSFSGEVKIKNKIALKTLESLKKK